MRASALRSVCSLGHGTAGRAPATSLAPLRPCLPRICNHSTCAVRAWPCHRSQRALQQLDSFDEDIATQFRGMLDHLPDGLNAEDFYGACGVSERHPDGMAVTRENIEEIVCGATR